MSAVASPQELRSLGLSPAEYDQILLKLGRAPNVVELGMLGAMWSEHCGYKHSRALLGRLPTGGEGVVQGPGENAGAVQIGDGLLAVLKIESHNHPSAVEPFQGAATGVGGILRDIFTMGARPVALLDSLRFGPPQRGRNAYLVEGVIGGIAGYGNCVGVPTVGGEVYFHPSYSANPLVNVMCVGIVRQEDLVRAKASGEGNLVVLVGADTGRDGLQGASFASVEDPERSYRGVVQVGNPFLEKLLLEACLEIAPGGELVGMQDLGAAGLTSSSVELAARGGCGVEIDVARVSRREAGMSPYEVMLSESQERMLLVVRPTDLDHVQAVFARWGLHSDVVGRVTRDSRIRVLEQGTQVAELPITLLTREVPTYEYQPIAPPQANGRLLPSRLPPEPDDLGRTLLEMLGSPNLCSRAYAYRQFDHMVQGQTVLAPGLGAAVVRVPGTSKALALTTDGNASYCLADPHLGAQIAVAEAARNLACRGAKPLAVTDCLNLGSPERAEVYWQLGQVIDGLASACQALGVPVVSGNVSLYNESGGVAVSPTPVVGMLGLVEDVSRLVRGEFQGPGHAIFLLGPQEARPTRSEYFDIIHNMAGGPPPGLDLALELSVQRLLQSLVADGLLLSAEDCSEGGLAVTLAACALVGGAGATLEPAALERLAEQAGGRCDVALFGETQSRIVVSCLAAEAGEVQRRAERAGISALRLGTTGGAVFAWGGLVSLPLEQMRERWENGFERMLSPGGER